MYLQLKFVKGKADFKGRFSRDSLQAIENARSTANPDLATNSHEWEMP